jgi:hypothetical protein
VIRRDPDELVAPAALRPSLEEPDAPKRFEKPVFKENRLQAEPEVHPMSRGRQSKWKMFRLAGS